MLPRFLRRLFSRTLVPVTPPADVFTVMEWEEDGMPCVATMNSALKDFARHELYPWQLKLWIRFEDLALHGMPTQVEQDIVDPFCNSLDARICRRDNALFFSRENCNGLRRMIWRVHDAEIAKDALEDLVKSQQYARPFEYRIEEDADWRLARWYFEQLGGGEAVRPGTA